MKPKKMDIKKPVLAALLAGFVLSPTIVLAFGAGVETSPNVSTSGVDVEIVNKTFERSKQRRTSETVCPAASTSAEPGCKSQDEQPDESADTENSADE